MTDEMTAVEWDDTLSSFEYMMFRADGDHRSRTTIGTVDTLDATPDWDRLHDHMDRASRLVPRLRQHVVAPLVPIAPARWVYDPDFDLDYHLRRVALAGSGGMRELLDYAETLHATPLDATRPLWEMTLVEGLDLPDATAALVSKFSHSVTDGVGGQILDRLMRQDERDADRGPMPAIPSPDDVSPLEMTRHAARRLPLRVVASTAKRIVSGIGDAAAVVRSPAAAVENVAKTIDTVLKLTGSAGAEPSPLLARRGASRRFEAMSFPLSSLRNATKAHGFSVNDGYIAAVCGVLRRYHDARGVPVRELPLAMPINVRPSDGSGNASNQWSAGILDAPIGIADPVDRMRVVREQVLTARSSATLNPASLIAPVVNWIPNGVIGPSALGIDVQASNVPGYPHARYIAGGHIVQSVPIGPTPGVAMMIAMTSMDGKCHVGVSYDTASITDAELFVTCLHEGFGEVFAAASTPPSPTTRVSTTPKKKATVREKSTAKKATARRKVTARKTATAKPKAGTRKKGPTKKTTSAKKIARKAAS